VEEPRVQRPVLEERVDRYRLPPPRPRPRWMQ
jgi:hypothetical protein